MRTNLRFADRFVRVVLGTALLMIMLGEHHPGWALVSLYALVTGVVGFGPFGSLLRVDTPPPWYDHRPRKAIPHDYRPPRRRTRMMTADESVEVLRP